MGENMNREKFLLTCNKWFAFIFIPILLSACTSTFDDNYNQFSKNHELLRQYISGEFDKNGGLDVLNGSLPLYFQNVEGIVNLGYLPHHDRSDLLSIANQAYLSKFPEIRFTKQTECFVGYEDFEDDTFPNLYDEIAKVAALEKFIRENGAKETVSRTFLARATENQINTKLLQMHKAGKIKGSPIIISYFLYCRGGPAFANYLIIDFPKQYDLVNLVPDLGFTICQKLGRNPFSSRCKYRRQFKRGDDEIDIIGKWRYQLFSDENTKQSFVNVNYGETELVLK